MSVSGRPLLFKKRDVAIVVVLAVLWLLPITWVGAMKRDVRFLPNWIRHQQRIACLFTGSVRTWRTYHVEVRFGDDPTWVEYDPPEFQMQVFGYRSRLHRLLGHSFKKSRGNQRIRDVSYYIKAGYDDAHPLGPPMVALRFARLAHAVKDLAKETCQFSKPKLKDLEPRRKLQRFGEIDFRNPKPLRPNLRRKSPRKRR